MKRLFCTLAALVAALSLWADPAPARANVFCPATVAALSDLAPVGRADTYGVLLDVDRGDTRSVRLRLDTDRTRYALDVPDVPLMGVSGLQLARYFTLPLGEHVLGAWVESTGLSQAQRLDCPVTSPWGASLPRPTAPEDAAAAERMRRTLLDDFGTRTLPIITPTAFGAVQSIACAQPNAAPRALAPVKPAFPLEARAVNATGVVEIRADVDDAGTLVGAAVTRSSGFAPLDRVALETAKRARYAPGAFACRPVAASLTFTTGFGT